MSIAIDASDDDILKKLRKYMEDSIELSKIIDLFIEYPELDLIRLREVGNDSEDCYGPWTGGEYYSVALKIALKEWSNYKNTQTDEYRKKLEDELAQLRKEKQELEKSNSGMSYLLYEIFRLVMDNKSVLEDSVLEQLAEDIKCADIKHTIDHISDLKDN